jgi:hypothetical protein
MATRLDARQWVSLVTKYSGDGDVPQRDTLVGVSVTLAARLLGVTRSRIHQLLKTKKLFTVDVYDETDRRIGHMVTFRSIEHRRRTALAGRERSSLARYCAADPDVAGGAEAGTLPAVLRRGAAALLRARRSPRQDGALQGEYGHAGARGDQPPLGLGGEGA